MNKFSVLDALFTFVFSPKAVEDLGKVIPVWGETMYLSYTKGTDIFQYQTLGHELLIIGFCVDSHGEIQREDIGEVLLKDNPNIDALYERANRLSGKYIVIYSDERGRYLFGDATGSLQINFFFEGESLYVASTDKMIASLCKLPLSDRSKKIRAGAALSQSLPGDMTMYDGVRTLLPNHYLRVSDKAVIRTPIPLPHINNEEDNYKGCIENSIFLIDSTVKEYQKRYDLICPLTSGYDSRVVFSFLNKHVSDLECFTFWHPGFTLETDDLHIPDQICKIYGVQYSQIHDLIAPKDYSFAIKAYAGEYINPGTIDLAYTLRTAFPQKAIVTGDIIDQVGKSLLGNSLPECFATERFFQCKIHNTEKLAREELKHYLDEIKSFGCFKQVYDLFAIENRCGRWATQGGTMYSLMSVPALNIFNCREILSLWMAIPRKLRVGKYIHKMILKEIAPQLCDIPFNPSNKTDLLKQNPYTFLMATYLKHIIQIISQAKYDKFLA